MAVVAGGQQPVAVGQLLRAVLIVGVEVAGIGLYRHGSPLPHHRVLLRVKLYRAGVVVGRTASAVVNDGNVAVGQPIRSVGAPQRLVAVIGVTGRSLARAVVVGVAPAVHNIAALAVDHIHFRKIAGGHANLVGLRIIGHAVEVRPVRPGIGAVYLGGAELVDVDLVLALADMIPHMPFPHGLAGGPIHFTDKIRPDAVKVLLLVRIAFLEQIALVGGLHAFGQGFIIALEFPAEQQIVAIGHDFIGMMRHFLAGNIHFVFPNFLAVPVELFHDSGGSAEKAEPGFLDFRQHAVTGQCAVRLQLSPEAGVLAHPFVDDFAVVVDQIGGLAVLGREQHIAFRGTGLIGEHTKRPAERLIGKGRSGKGRREGSGCHE